MKWALVKKNGDIFRQNRNKYGLLKWGIETKLPITKKTIKNFKSGDEVVIVFRKTYKKWLKNSRGRLYQDWVEEVSERTYTLRQFSISFH